MLSIWSSPAELPGPRSANATHHKLLDVVTIALTASIHGAESCVDFADFGRDREPLFRDFLELPGGELPGGLPSQTPSPVCSGC